jgi:HAE1 family hydrophobic/amphiphilic exporter-1
MKMSELQDKSETRRSYMSGKQEKRFHWSKNISAAEAIYQFIKKRFQIVAVYSSVAVFLSFAAYHQTYSQTQSPTPPADKTTFAPAPAASPSAETGGWDVDPDLTKEPLLQNLNARPVPPRVVMNRTGISDRIVVLKLDEAVRRGLENNSEIEIARDEVRLAESVLQALEGVYDPVFRFNSQFERRAAPTPGILTGSFRGDGKLRETDLQFDGSAAQFLRRGGGQYEFFFGNQRRGTDGYLAQLSPYYTSNFGFSFTQQLLRDRRIDSRRREISIQRKRLGQSDAEFRRRTIEVIAEVQNAYWELVFALRDYQNRVSGLDLAREQFRQTEARIAEGEGAPLERAETESELARREAEVLRATRGVTVAENNLKRLILPNASDSQWEAQIIPVEQPPDDASPFTLEAALADARANRQELARLRIEREINEIDERYFKNQKRPRVDLQTSFSVSGLAGNSRAERGGAVPGLTTFPNITSENLYGGYGQTLGNLLRADGHRFSVGVRVEIPFRNRTAKAQLAGTQIRDGRIEAELRGAEQAVVAEVRNAVQEAEAARQILSKMREARSKAEIQLKGERQLSLQGRSTLFLLFERQSRFVNARTEELRAETEYQKAIARLQRATGTTLQIFGINLSEE